MRIFLLLGALVMASPAPAVAKGLTVPMGETWIFRLSHGQPFRARKVAPDAKPRRGEIRLTLRAMIGTTMTLISNSPRSYTYRATLIGVNGKEVAARSCALPADNRFAFESWPLAARAVRVGDFKPAGDDSVCP